MIYNKQSIIDDINTLVADMRAGKYILCNKPIRNILRYIVSNSDLKYIVSHANTAYKFQDVFAEATANPPRFVMPTDHYKVVSMVTGLLFSIDKGETDFLYLLRYYFDGETVDAQFDDFCVRVMKSYANSFSVLISLGDNVISLEEEKSDHKLQSVPLQKQLSDSIFSIIDDIADKLIAYNALSVDKRDECMTVLELLYYAVEEGYGSLLKGIWIGVKYTLSMCKDCAPELRTMEKVLRDFGYI